MYSVVDRLNGILLCIYNTYYSLYPYKYEYKTCIDKVIQGSFQNIKRKGFLWYIYISVSVSVSIGGYDIELDELLAAHFCRRKADRSERYCMDLHWYGVYT